MIIIFVSVDNYILYDHKNSALSLSLLITSSSDYLLSLSEILTNLTISQL